MFRRILHLVTLGLVCLICVAGIPGQAFADATREYQIKAAFIYNFLKFTEWPEVEAGQVDRPIIIGIIGGDDFSGAFAPLARRLIKGRTVVTRHFPSMRDTDGPRRNADTESITGCHLVFVSDAEASVVGGIIQQLESLPVLTVSDSEGFIEEGGIIQFTTQGKKARFAISLVAAKRSDISISSKLLRLADRVVDDVKKEEAEQ